MVRCSPHPSAPLPRLGEGRALTPGPSPKAGRGGRRRRRCGSQQMLQIHRSCGSQPQTLGRPWSCGKTLTPGPSPKAGRGGRKRRRCGSQQMLQIHRSCGSQPQALDRPKAVGMPSPSGPLSQGWERGKALTPPAPLPRLGEGEGSAVAAARSRCSRFTVAAARSRRLLTGPKPWGCPHPRPLSQGWERGEELLNSIQLPGRSCFMKRFHLTV